MGCEPNQVKATQDPAGELVLKDPHGGCLENLGPTPAAVLATLREWRAGQ